MGCVVLGIVLYIAIITMFATYRILLYCVVMYSVLCIVYLVCVFVLCIVHYVLVIWCVCVCMYAVYVIAQCACIVSYTTVLCCLILYFLISAPNMLGSAIYFEPLILKVFRPTKF